ncbi:CapK domain protein [Pseudomonas syringae pv. coriandricola]|nr:CapK domain protein [Pseudomonas syringae pv. coriandricola]
MGLYDSTLILETSGVKEFQIVQTHLDKIEIRIVLMDKEGAYNYVLMSNFVSGIKQLFSGDPLTVSVHVLESIPAAKSYKRRLIVNMINS